jgi:DNA-binding MurR/RpiR family transcriptional regulator
MNPFQLMELHRPDFTPNDLVICQTILDNPTQVTYKTISRLAEDCGVSQPAISRFVKGLGYNRYQDFRADLIACLALQNESQKNEERSGYFQNLHHLLQQAEDLLTPAYMQELVAYIGSFRRVYASGMGKSFQPARLLEALMRKTGRDVRAIEVDYLAEAADYMEKEDLLILFSVSGHARIMNAVARTNGSILLVTTTPKYAFPEVVSRAILLPYVTADPETSSISPVLFDIFAELLVNTVAEQEETALPASNAPAL